MRWIAIIVLTNLLGLSLILLFEGGEARLTVSGRGEVAAAPDTATVVLGTVTRAGTAREALALNGAATRAALETMAAAGVDAADIRTSGLTLRPLASRKPPGGSDDATPRIDGYEVRNTVTALVRDLPSLGVVLEAAVSAGANEFRSLSFGLSDPAPLVSEARRRAVADARAAAETLADAAGVTLGPLISFDLTDGRGAPVPVAREASFASSRVPISEGEVTVAAGVTMVWETRAK